jgi:hypothetical protein
MTTRTSDRAEYRQELQRLAQLLTAAGDAPADLLARVARPDQLAVFAEENRDKRCALLGMHLKFLRQAIDDLDERFKAYSRQQTLQAYVHDSEDAQRFLDWLRREGRLTAEQRDHVACQAARLEVEAQALADRRAHVRFQELWSVSEELAAELEANPDLRVHLNPLRAWACFHTRALLDEEASVPAQVLFFAVGRDIHTAVLEEEGKALVEELAGLAPCTVASWAAVSRHAGAEELTALCRDLSDMGLVAFS